MKKVPLYFLLVITLYANQHLQKVSLQLLWKHQFEFAGFYMAKEKGFYKEVGLDVEFKEYKKGIDIIKDVEKGKSTFGISYPTIVLDILRNSKLMLLNAIFQSSPHVLVTLKSSGIKRISDFKNKKIMIDKNAFKTAPLLSMLYSDGIRLKDMKIVKESFNIDDLINKKVDISSAFLSNEIYRLKNLGIKYDIWNPASYGFEFYDDILFTSYNLAKKNPSLVKRFQKASLKGWKYAFSHIEESVDVILKKYNTQHKTKEALLYEAEILKKLAYYNTKKLGKIELKRIENIYNIYKLMGFSPKKSIDLREFIFNFKESDLEYAIDLLKHKYKKKIIKICTNNDWKPIEFVQNGKPYGISIDTLKLIEEKTGLKFEFIKTKSWKESQEFLRSKKCDILPSAIKTVEREKYANFTKPYLEYKLAIVTNKDKPIVRGLSSIIDESMTRKKGSGLISKLKRLYPSLRIIETSNFKDSFDFVRDDKAYFTISTIPVLLYYSNLYNYDFQISGYTDMVYKLSIAVRKDDKILLQILNDALSLITKAEQNIIYEKWTTQKVINRYNYRYILLGILVAVIIIVIILLYAVKLQKEISKRERTEKELDKLNKELEDRVKKSVIELEKQNDALRESVESFETLYNMAMEGIILSQKGIIKDINETAVKVLGFTNKAEMIGWDIYSLIEKSNLYLAKRSLNKDISEPFELNLLTKDKIVVSVIVSGRNIKLNGELFRISTFIDISKLKEKEVILQRQSRLASMGEMIGSIAHQWRQPLNALAINIQNLDDDYEEGLINKEFIDKFIDKNMATIKFMSKTIDDFRNFFKADKRKMDFSIKKVIKEVLSIQDAQLKNYNIEIYLIGDDFIFNSYESEFKQVILNIINNAKDAIVEKKVEKGKIVIRLEDHKISIEDNGGGIPKKVKERIFEPYFTTKEPGVGTGIGLYMSKIIIEKNLGGKIDVLNKEDGTVFVLYLKRSDLCIKS